LNRLDLIKSIVVCPKCRLKLNYSASNATCSNCNSNFKISNDKIYLTTQSVPNDSFDAVKNRLKNFLGKYYYIFGIKIIAPVYPYPYENLILKKLTAGCIGVNIGSGNVRIHDQLLNVDITDYPEVDIICDAQVFPFDSDSLDHVVSIGLIEHIRDPDAFVRETYRCVRPGGWSHHLVPFLYPFHASPFDYFRYSAEGLKVLFRDWKILNTLNITGPFSLISIVATEVIATVFTFGFNPLRNLVYLFLCLLIFPLKFLDVFFVGRKQFEGLAPTFFIQCQK